MDQPDYRTQTMPLAKAPAKAAPREWTRTWWFRLLAVLMFVELIMPFVLWQAGLRYRTDFTKDVIAGIIIALTLLYMLTRDRLPAAVLMILAISLIWGLVALFEGQALTATLWGWWRLFKYPLLMVFAYLIPRWPKDTARLIFKFFVVMMLFQVGVQLIQWAAGQVPGDSLAGTFGNKGVGPYTVFIFLAVCMGLGHWLATGQWKAMMLLMALGLVATMLSVTKFYLFAAAVLGVLAMGIHLIRGGRFRHLVVYVVLFLLAMAAFVPIYNNFIAATRGLKPLQEYATREAIDDYLFKGEKLAQEGRYKLGRGGAIVYAWQQIRRDNTATLFGFGLGSRTFSDTLGLAGATMEDDLYGGGGNTSLGVWIQEYGLVGISLFLAINIWMIIKLSRFAKATSDPYQATLAYGLILYTLMWPMWLWYHKTWLYGVMMISYWVTLGYLFTQIYPRHKRRGRPVMQPADRDELPPPLHRH
ncbi:MAG: hypothetical protein KBG73_15110 [Candidatus Promineofilum sp.]|nr:hypothetical protein [Promineifilum sp.]